MHDIIAILCNNIVLTYHVVQKVFGQQGFKNCSQTFYLQNHFKYYLEQKFIHPSQVNHSQ